MPATLRQRLRLALEAQAPEHTPELLVVDGFDDMTPVEESILLALARHIQARGGEVLVTLPFEPERASLFASAGSLRLRLLASMRWLRRCAHRTGRR